MKTITIIIPTYNMAAYLGTCLSSLIIERLERVEVIVINDGSKDNSAEVAQEFIDKYPETFKIINKQNENYGSCINRGLAEAQGKYIKVLDSDDSFDTVNFATMVSLLEKIDVDLFLSNTIQIKGLQEHCKTLPFPKDTEFDYIKFLQGGKHLGKIAMHEVTYRRAIFKELCYTQSEGIFYTDNEWIFKPMVKVRKAYYMNKPVYRYLLCREGQSVSEDVMKKHFSDDIAVTIKMLKDYNEMVNLCPDLKDIFFKQIYLRVTWLYRRALVKWQMYDNDELIEFDKILKEDYISLYKKTEKEVLSRRFPTLKYTQVWRKDRKSKKLKFFIRLYNFKKKIGL